MILVAAPPACGKNYVSELICNAVGNISYFDKDDLAPLIHRSFALCGEKVDMDGSFYLQNLRFSEYETLFDMAFSALRFSSTVLINAPLLREVRDESYMRALKERAHALGASLTLVWVMASRDVCCERMRARGAQRDERKLARWEEYVARTDFSVPYALQESGAVDVLFAFDNENEQTAQRSLQQFLMLSE